MHNTLTKADTFRQDINGLRAWAVVAVVLFHFNLIALPGGFSGVDVFFVISGYLMTAIIVRGHEKGDFSILRFYLARARRILPAFLLMTVVLLSLGWFWLSPLDYQALGTQSTYGSVFFSNVHFWKSAGYFDSIAEEKWLLHTWTLAVEVQFYLLYPLFISVIWRLWKSLKAILMGVVVLFICSLALNFFVTDWRPNAAFYLLPTRGWELAAGGIVYLMAKQTGGSKKLKAPINGLGWGLIFTSFLFINEDLAWPGYWAILPVLGTSLIILGQRHHCMLTDNAITQWLGDRSYSLYLWHWPVFVALYFSGLQYEWYWLTGGIIASLLLAHFSYQYVEQPSRQSLSQTSSVTQTVVLFCSVALIILASLYAQSTNNDDRVPENIRLVANESNNYHPRRDDCEYKGGHKLNGCEFNDNPDISVILIGDSHAMSTVNPLNMVLEGMNKNGIIFHHNWCPTIDGLTFIDPKHKHRKCLAFNELVNSQLTTLDKTTPVVIVNSYLYFLDTRLREISLDSGQSAADLTHLTERYIRSICRLQRDRKVFLVRPYPNMDYSVPERISRNFMFENDEDITVPFSEYRSQSKNLWDLQDRAVEQCGATVLDPLPHLCDKDLCYGSMNGMPLYYDHSHLSEYGNRRLVPMFESMFEPNF